MSIYNELCFEQEARDKLLRGATKLTRAVKSTLGPKGRNVIIQQSVVQQLITKDGVTVAKSIILEDPFENLGAQLVREVAAKTAEVAGDGTTTATVLAHALIEKGNLLIINDHDPISLKRGMDEALSDVKTELLKMSSQVTSFKEIEHIGTISANNDKIIGSLIAKAMESVGKEGVITIEESNNFDTKLEIVQGVRFNRGYRNQVFITHEKRQEVIFSEPLIFITDKKFLKMSEITTLLEAIARADKQLLLICGDIEGEALSAMMLNKIRGVIKACAVQAPSFGEARKEILKDLAVTTGGTFFDSEFDTDFMAHIDLNTLGTARRVVVNKSTTTIIDGVGTDEAVANRITELKTHLEEDGLSETQIETLKYRIASLSGGVAVIRVGAFTDTELSEKVARIEDALNATQAAVEEGIVPGGGLALLRAADIIKNEKLSEVQPDIKSGYQLVLEACRIPFAQINLNAGFDPEKLLTEINENQLSCGRENLEIGFNTLTGKVVNLFDAGIIDPLKVERCALENAVSVAQLLLTTDTLIITAKNNEL